MPILKLRGIAAGPDGIVWYSDDDLDRSVWVRLKPADDGRNEVVELYISPDERPVSTDDLRRIPLGRIESWANGTGREQLEAQRGVESISIPDYCAEQTRGGEQILEQANARRRASWRLPKPAAGQNYGDDFYKAVARLYNRLAEEGRPPGTTIADANGVPTSTARRWIKESRARGFLAPGRTGKAG